MPQLLPLFVVMSLYAWTMVANVHVLPALARRSRREALMIAVTPHMFRHVGAMALYPGITNLPAEWTVPLAWGDGITAVLAASSITVLWKSWRHATKVVWVFNVFGLLDLLHNGFNAARLELGARFGLVGYVVGFGVPMMLVFHILVFRILLRRER
jgi:hypothetical protein